MEKNLFRCIPQCRKTSSIVCDKGGKPPLYPTTEEILFHCGITEENLRRCGIQCGRFFCAVSINAEKFHCSFLFFCVVFITKKMSFSSVGYNMEKAFVFWDTVHCIRFFYGVGYNGRTAPALWDTTKKNHLCCIPLWKKNSCVVGYNRKQFVSHPEIVVRCIPKRTAKNLKLNIFTKKMFSAKGF
jgi:hypothetical protein